MQSIASAESEALLTRYYLLPVITPTHQFTNTLLEKKIQQKCVDNFF